MKQQRKADGYAEVDNNQKLGEIPTIREDTDGIFEGLQFAAAEEKGEQVAEQWLTTSQGKELMAQVKKLQNKQA